MFARAINLPKNRSFFLFGARGTGKTSLLKRIYGDGALYIDLLNLDSEAKYQLEPERLYRELSAIPAAQRVPVIIDEVQKVPKLLDVVHRKIEEGGWQFVLTGSSARKLKRGAANLLAGRAAVFHLFPLLANEIGPDANTDALIQFGALPQVVTAANDLDRKRYLKAYSQTYLKEEVWGEQFVRKIEPFRKFLPMAAQMHGQPVNFSKIGRAVGVDDSTVKSYYSILEDTLIGFFLESYSGSIRRQLRATPKFYLFDTGVKRTLKDQIDFPAIHGTYEYGVLFETLVISEIMRRVAYREISLRFSYLSTEGGAEIDLVVSQGKKVVALIEIKSSSTVDPTDLQHLRAFQDDFKGASFYCLYGGHDRSDDNGIRIYPWRAGVDAIVQQITPPAAT
jgi:uncharacterized protein